MDYDVIIAGASFGGLAVAAQLRGFHVLLVDPQPVGAAQTSACGTLLAVLEATDTMNSLLQIHERFVLHLANRSYEIPLPDPFCTFDYRLFCRRLFAQGNAALLPAAVLGREGHTVHTSAGTFTGKVLVDASGWRAALASDGQHKNRHPQGMSFGLETTVPITEKGLHFWYDPGRLLPRGVTWLFPTGANARAGIGSYAGHTRLKTGLERWLADTFDKQGGDLHGGYFPYARRPVTSGCVFRVGDAAGQCLPLTGEGIRPALYFGAIAGRLARMVIAGQLGEADALRLYRRQVNDHRPLYDFLFLAQKSLTNVPLAVILALATFLERAGLFPRFLRWYRRVMEPATLATTEIPTGEVLLLRTEEAGV